MPSVSCGLLLSVRRCLGYGRGTNHAFLFVANSLICLCVPTCGNKKMPAIMQPSDDDGSTVHAQLTAIDHYNQLVQYMTGIPCTSACCWCFSLDLLISTSPIVDRLHMHPNIVEWRSAKRLVHNHPSRYNTLRTTSCAVRLAGKKPANARQDRCYMSSCFAAVGNSAP